jgi:beta-phosphoglucomutase-like phosphatase (HAD superfamily)
MKKSLSKNILAKGIKAVILDMDGVLVDTEPVHLESFKILLRDLQMDYDESLLNSFVGHSVESNIRVIFQKIGKAVPGVLSVEQARREAIYLDLLQKTDLHPLPGIPDLFTICKKNKLKLALATSSIREQVDTILEKLSRDFYDHLLDLNEVWNVIVSGDQVKHKKPAADIYEQVIGSLALKPAQCLAIEDSPSGIQSAKAAGVYCIALKNRYWLRDQLQEAQADWVVDSIGEIVSELTGLNAT